MRWLGGIVVVALSTSLTMHVVPGFNKWQMTNELALSSTSLPFSLYLNFDKPFIGLIILGFGFPIAKGLKDWKEILVKTAPIFCIGMTFLLTANFIAGYAVWDPKMSNLFPLWCIRNLFFTCVSEEAFFRGFLQKNLSAALSRYKWGGAFSIISIALLFEVAHIEGGPVYVVLSTITGIIYGYAYHKTQRIESSIICHFGVNTFHFLFLAYPASIAP